MRTIYKSALKAHVSLDAANRVRHIRHSQEYWPGPDNVPRLSAQAYLHAWADTLQIPLGQLGNLSKKVSFLDPREQGIEYHLHSVAANNAAEVTVGPFEWEPNINAYGHDCVLMIASVAGDPSNVDNFTGAESIQEWRLVPHDNNVGQRNVSVVPGAGGGEALRAALDGAFFVAGNNLNKGAAMELRVGMPAVLARKGWQLQFAGLQDGKFALKAGEKRTVHLTLKAGSDFTPADIAGAADRMITVDLLGNGLLLGGMSYDVDPHLKQPSGGKQPQVKDCDGAAQKLLACLDLSGGTKVKSVCVKKVSLDIELDNDCGCA